MGGVGAGPQHTAWVGLQQEAAGAWERMGGGGQPPPAAARGASTGGGVVVLALVLRRVGPSAVPRPRGQAARRARAAQTAAPLGMKWRFAERDLAGHVVLPLSLKMRTDAHSGQLSRHSARDASRKKKRKRAKSTFSGKRGLHAAARGAAVPHGKYVPQLMQKGSWAGRDGPLGSSGCFPRLYPLRSIPIGRLQAPALRARLSLQPDVSQMQIHGGLLQGWTVNGLKTIRRALI